MLNLFEVMSSKDVAVYKNKNFEIRMLEELMECIILNEVQYSSRATSPAGALILRSSRA